MAIQNRRKETILDAKKLLSLIILLNISCGVLVQEKDVKENYNIVKLKSQDSSTYLSLYSFNSSDKSKELRPCYRINKILFCDFKNKIENPLNVVPGEFSLSTSYIGKLDSKLENLKIKEGDSIIINFFLKNDPIPLN